MTDIVEWLRDIASEQWAKTRFESTGVRLREAADEIERLRAERDRQYDENVNQIVENQRLRSESDTLHKECFERIATIGRLRAALKKIIVETGAIESDFFRPEIAKIAREAIGDKP